MVKAPAPTSIGSWTRLHQGSDHLPREMPEPEYRFPNVIVGLGPAAIGPIGVSVPRERLALRRARGETGDVVVDQEGVGDGNRDGPEKPAAISEPQKYRSALIRSLTTRPAPFSCRLSP